MPGKFHSVHPSRELTSQYLHRVIGPAVLVEQDPRSARSKPGGKHPVGVHRIPEPVNYYYES